MGRAPEANYESVVLGSNTEQSIAAAQFCSIGELSEAMKVSPAMIRLYEQQGLLKPQRIGRLRVYSAADKKRLATILRLRRLDMSINEMSSVLTALDEAGLKSRAGNTVKVLNTHLTSLEKRLAELQAMVEQTSMALANLLRPPPSTA